MKEQWQELKETIIELRDNDGTGTQQEVCKFLVNYMGVLEKQIQEPCDDAVSRKAVFNAIEREDKWLLAAKGHNELTEMAFSGLKARIDALLPVTQKSGKWIPVRERLPEEGQEILFSTKTGRVHSGKYHDDDSANQWYSHKDKCRAWNNVVSAWMPLPEPYKAESEEISDTNMKWEDIFETERTDE